MYVVHSGLPKPFKHLLYLCTALLLQTREGIVDRPIALSKLCERLSSRLKLHDLPTLPLPSKYC
jgi:hypothetical protein